MNKKLAILALTLLFPLAAIAQRGGDYDYEEPDKDVEKQVSSSAASSGMEFHYGFKAGMNLATYSSDSDDLQARLGQMGVVCRFQWQNWAIQPEIFFAKMGVRSLEHMIDWHPEETWRLTGQYIVGHDDLLNEDFKLQMLTSNIQMPIMFKYYLPMVQHGINVQAGPVLSVNLDYDISSPTQKGYLANYEFGTHVYGTSTGAQTKGIQSLRRIARDRNRVVAMAQFGAGYDSKSGIGVDVRCAMGITPVFKSLYNTHAKDRVWSISFSYVF